MTSLMPTNSKIDLAATTATSPSKSSAPASGADVRRSNSLTGLISGNPDFDQLLDRLHVAFGELARTDNGNSTAAAEAAEHLSMTYTSITGRIHPQADDSAGLLASTLQQGLASVPTSLTDRLGQSMLRLL